MLKKSKYALPYWRIRLFNLLHSEHIGTIILRKEDISEIQKTRTPFFKLVQEIIENENGDNEKDKQNIFLEKSNLPDKFLRDMMKSKYTPKMQTVLAIPMGHSIDEISKDDSETLLYAAGLSLKKADNMNAVYNLLLNLRGTRHFEREAMSLPGDNKNRKRIDYTNEILHDTYMSNKKYWDKILNYEDQERIPTQFVLGYKGR